MSRRAWISVSGLIWAFAGFLLLYKGLRILSELPNPEHATWWVAAALLVGFIKGRFVLSKTVKRITTHISKLELPIRFTEVYPKSYWILLSSMIGLGVLMRFVPLHWRGFIDVAVGSALINGAMLYFRASRSLEVPSK